MTTSPKYAAASPIVSASAGGSPKKVPTYGCCAAWMWLAVIVAVKTVLIVAWITKEYYFFDFTCAIVVNLPQQDHYDEHADTVLVRNRRNLIPKVSLFRPSALIEIRRAKREMNTADIWWKSFKDGKAPMPSLPGNASSAENRRRKGGKHRKGKGRKKNRRKEESAEDHARVTKFPEKRFHLLGGADMNLDLGEQATTKSAHQSSWIDGIIDPRDPGFSNKGEIRAYSMKVAKKIPQPDAAMIRTMMEREEEEEETLPPPTVPFEPAEPSALPEAPTIAAPQAEPSTITTEEVSPRPVSAVWDPAPEIFTTRSDPRAEYGVQPAIVSRPTPIPERKSEFQPRPLDVVIVKDLGFKITTTPPPTRGETTTQVVTLPPTTPMPKHKRKENFTVQLNVFTSNALCIARTMTALWCAAQCATLLPFLLGVCAGLKCLLAPHFIFDALFLVVAFIASITITVFSLMLYAIVDEMPTPTLLEWIVFAVVVDVILIFYTIAFTVSLRCAEIIFDRPVAHPAKSSNYQNSAYYVTSPVAGSLNGGTNEQFV